jgi:hypothetical protein
MLRVAVVILFFCCPALSQLYPYKKEGKWGLINAEGLVIVEPSYDFISDYKNSLAIAKKDNKTGVLNSKGQPVLAFEYEQAAILGAVIAAWKNSDCFIYDSSGKQISDQAFTKASLFSKDKILTHIKNRKGILNFNGEVILPCEYDLISPKEPSFPFHKVSKDNKQGLLHTEGKLLLKPIYSQIWLETSRAIASLGKGYEVFEFDEKYNIANQESYINKAALDLALRAKEEKKIKAALKKQEIAYRWISEGFRFKLINQQAQNVLNGLEFYDLSVDSKSQKSLARRVGEDKRDICYYIDDANAKIIFEVRLKDILISDFAFGGYAKATIDTLWDALVDSKGQIINTIQGKKIKNIGLFSEKGLAYVLFSDGEYAFINAKADVLASNFQLASDFEYGYAIAKKDGKFGAYPDIPFVYDGINTCEEGLFRVKKGIGKEGKWGIINTKNSVVFPFEYDFIYPFENKHACFRKNGKSGLVDRSGKIIISAIVEADYIGEMNNSIAKISSKRNEKGFALHGYINQKGEMIVDCQYQAIEGFTEAFAQRKGVAKIVKNNKVGYLNHLGQVFIEPIYDKIEKLELVYQQNKGIAKATKNGKIGYLDNLGRSAIACLYDDIENFEMVLQDSSALFRVKSDGLYGYINAKGKEVVSVQYQELSEIRNGVICAKKDNLCGVLDHSGQILLPFLYASTSFLSETELVLVGVQNPRKVYFNSKGEPCEPINRTENKLPQVKQLKFVSFDAQLSVGVVKKENLLALAEGSGKLLTKYEYLQIGEFSEGLAYFQNQDKKFGYLDVKGKIVLEAKYHRATSFSESFAAVALSPNKWSYIKKDGSLAFGAVFKAAEPFSGGFALTNTNELINVKGEKTATLEVQTQAKFSNLRAVASDSKGAFHIGPDGMEAYSQRFDEVSPFFGELAFAKRGEVWQLTRFSVRQGEKDPSKVSETKLRFSKLEREIYLKENGTNKKYETQFQITQDIGWAKIVEGKWRMIDSDGNLISDAVFSEVEVFGNGVKAQSDISFGLFLGQKMILEPIYHSIRWKNGLVRIEKDSQTGYLSPTGSWVLKLD